MPTLDRYWWLRLLYIVPAIAFAAFTIYLLIAVIQSLLGDRQNLLFELLILVPVAILFGLSLSRTYSIGAARNRNQRRKEAIAGNQEAIPAAWMDQEVQVKAIVIVLPLSLLWQAKKGMRFIIAPFFALICVVFPAFIFYALLHTLFFGPDHLFTPIWQIQNPSIWDTLGFVILTGASFAITPIILLRTTPDVLRAYGWLFGRSYGIIATETGIEVRRAELPSQRMLWKDVRLLEVCTVSSRESHNSLHPANCRYILYSKRGSISWLMYQDTASFARIGMSNSAMQANHHALLRLITARTGLVPRTFNTNLQHQPRSQVTINVGNDTKLLFLAFLAVIFLGIAAVIIFPGVTTSLILNILLTLPILGIFLGVSISMLRKPAATMTVALNEQDMQQEYHFAPIESLDTTYTTDKLYKISYAPSSKRRLRSGLIGLACAMEALPLLFLLARYLPFLSWGQNLPYPVSTFAGSVACLLLLLIAFPGAVMVIASLRRNKKALQADASGLTWQQGNKKETIAWNAIKSIKVHIKDGKPEQYAVKLSGPLSIIAWPAYQKPDLQTTPASADYAAAARQLCAVISQRSHQQPRITSSSNTLRH